MHAYYHFAPDVHLIRLKDGSILFKSDSLSIKLEGASASFMADEIFPLINAGKHIDEIAQLHPSVSKEDLVAYLEQLITAGVLRGQDMASSEPLPSMPRYFSNLL